MSAPKTDNKHLDVKIAIREKLLNKSEKYHVFDSCAGESTIWDAMKRKGYSFGYCGIDKVGRGGNIRGDSMRYAKAVSEFNVVDIDTYGEPFGHLEAFQQYLKPKTIVFLTWGFLSKALGFISDKSLEFIGIPREWDLWPVHELRGIILKKWLCEFNSSDMLYYNSGRVIYAGFVVGETKSKKTTGK